MTDFADVLAAQSRLTGRIKKSPLVRSQLLEQWLSEQLPGTEQHTIWFKAECLQHTGAFKIRGATNFIAKLAEQNKLPEHFVANSSGNHAQAVACAAAQFGIPATIYAAQNISPIKAAATKSYGAQLALFETRPEADAAVKSASEEPNTVWIPPFNHPDIIAGQGTAVAEALQELASVDAVFAPCGGGGLVSGSLIATRALCPKAKVMGVEPLAANDAAESLRSGKIQSLTSPAKTLADGAATPSVGEFTFPFLKQLDGFYEVSEQDIVYWSQWLHHLLKLHIEPTCCMTMQAVAEYLTEQTRPQTLLVVLSGGNISTQTMATLFKSDHLCDPPHIAKFTQEKRE